MELENRERGDTDTHLRPRSLQFEHCGWVPVLEKGKSFRSQRTLFPTAEQAVIGWASNLPSHAAGPTC
jgi:hypothetical protein